MPLPSSSSCLRGEGPSFAPGPDRLCWFLSFQADVLLGILYFIGTSVSLFSVRPLSSAAWSFVSCGMVLCLLLDKCLHYELHPRAPLPSSASLRMPGVWLLLSLDYQVPLSKRPNISDFVGSFFPLASRLLEQLNLSFIIEINFSFTYILFLLKLSSVT